MGYLDIDDAWLIALTRQRRQELAEARRGEPIRFSASCETIEFHGVIACTPAGGRRREAAKGWRIGQWHAGNRKCTYCGVKTLKATKDGLAKPATCTVDHKEPLVLGGDDVAWNWAIACWLCNNRKGRMTEAEFRALLEAEKNPPAWVDGGRLTA